jgi:hypothetical protein
MKLNKQIAENFLKDPKNTDLSVYTEIEIDASKILQKSKFYKLNLSSLSQISIGALKNIVKFKGWLILDGIKQFDIEQFSLLGQHSGTLFLNSINEISKEAYTKLLSHDGDIYLEGLKGIQQDLYKLFKQTEGRIILNLKITSLPETRNYLEQNLIYSKSLTEKIITKEIASEFIQNNIKSLDDYTSINKDAAKYLAAKKNEYELKLNGLKYVDDENIELLSKFRFDNYYSEEYVKGISKILLQLNGLVEVSDKSLIYLFSNFKGHQIELKSLRSISKVVAEAISKYRFAVYLDGLEEITDDVAQILSSKDGLNGNNVLSLTGLKSFSDKSSAYLSKFKGLLLIDGIEILDKKTASHIAQYRGLFNWKHSSLNFPKIKSLDSIVAKELATFTGNIVLNGLENISNDVALILTKWNCNSLHLGGIEKINFDTLQILSESNITFSLINLKHLNKESILLLHKSSNSYSFDLINEISVDSLELIASKEKNNVFIRKVGEFNINTLPLLLKLKISFPYSKSKFNREAFQIVVEYLKVERYNFYNIQPENRDEFLDDFIIFLVESNQLEVLEIVPKVFNSTHGTFNTLQSIDSRLIKIMIFVIKKYGGENSLLTMNNIEKVEIDTLRILESEANDYTFSSIELNGLKSIKLEEIEILSKCKTASLSLNSLSNLPPNATKYLSKISGIYKPEEKTDRYIIVEQKLKKITLNGIQNINLDFLDGFLEYDGILNLNGIDSLNDDLIYFLSNCNNNLSISLNGIKNVTDHEIKKLTCFTGKSLNLWGIAYLSDQALEYIAKMNYDYLKSYIIDTRISLHPIFDKRINKIRGQIN